MKQSGIYKIVNNINGRCYIGSAKNIKRRWQHHICSLKKQRHSNPFLQADYNKCGQNCLNFLILEECVEEAIIEREQYWLNIYYDDQNQCYNLRKIAESNRGYKASDATRQKMREAKKGFRPSPATIEGCIKYHSGRKKDENERKAMSDGWIKKLSSLTDEERKSHSNICSERSKRAWTDPVIRQKLLEARAKERPYRRKAVIQYDLEGKIVAEYDSVNIASEKTGISFNLIKKVILGYEGRTQTHGYVFKYKESI